MSIYILSYNFTSIVYVYLNVRFCRAKFCFRSIQSWLIWMIIYLFFYPLFLDSFMEVGRDKAMPFCTKALSFSVNTIIIEIHLLYSTLYNILISHMQIIAEIEKKSWRSGKGQAMISKSVTSIIDLISTMSDLLDGHANWFS